MSELGGAIAIGLGLILIIGGFKGSLLKAARVIDTGIPGAKKSTGLASLGLGLGASPGPGAPGSGVTTQ